MFSGIRSLIFGAYEEDANLATVQPNLTAAQLLPSLEDQQREEEERLLRENQPTVNQKDALDESHHLSDLENIAEDTWEMINFDDEESSKKKVSFKETTKIIEHSAVFELAANSGQSDSADEENHKVKIEGVEDAKNPGVKLEERTVQRDGNQIKAQRKLNVSARAKKTKGCTKIIDQKQISGLPSPATTSAKSGVDRPVFEPLDSSISQEREEKLKSVSSVIIRPTLSFAAITAKNSPIGQSTSSPITAQVKPVESSPLVITKVKPPSSVGCKRQRPISSSSWSSQSDLNDPIIADSDDESIASSDFSDCDYDHGYNHNHLMKGLKLKHSNKHKAQRGHTTSKTSVVEKFAILEDGEKEEVQERKNQTKFSTKNFGKIIHGRSTRNKKKKLLNESVFSPKVSALDTVREPNSDVAEVVGNSKTTSQVPKAQQCMGPPPPPPPPTTNNSSGNDSSDAAEMDESWFVTPPSCFDGCKSPKKVSRNNAQNKNCFSRATKKENAKNHQKVSKPSGDDLMGGPKNLSPESTDSNHRSSSSTELENLLIEHPSMYIPRLTNWEEMQKYNRNIIEESIYGVSPKYTRTNKKVTCSPVTDAPLEKTLCKVDTSKTPDVTKAVDAERDVTPIKGEDTSATLNAKKNALEDKKKTIRVAKGSKTKHEIASFKKSSKQSLVTLISARPLLDSSRASSSPSPGSSLSPFSSDNEEDLEDTMSQYQPDTTEFNKGSCDIVAQSLLLSMDGDQSVETKSEKLEAKDEELVEIETNNENRPQTRVNFMQLQYDHAPYWQKKKMRQQRPSQARRQKMRSKNSSPCSGKISSCSSVSERTSETSATSLSSAGIINRIGSSIVANITNLTTTIPNVQNISGIAEEMRKFAENVENGFQRNPIERKRTTQRELAKSIMARQNKRVAADNGNRRVGRSTKMFTHPNGYSIDRKVQKNFH